LAIAVTSVAVSAGNAGHAASAHESVAGDVNELHGVDGGGATSLHPPAPASSDAPSTPASVAVAPSGDPESAAGFVLDVSAPASVGPDDPEDEQPAARTSATHATR
jgi:hypothetical protein